VKSRARHLLDKSINAMLAALEIYNKPSFSYREDSFAILAVNSWELLLKARILQLDRNRLAALLEYEKRKRSDGSYSGMLYRKKNRAGNYVTIGLFRAFDRLVNEYKDSLDAAVRTNLDALVEIRDNSVHFLNSDDLVLNQAIHEIGTATIKNYVALVRQWFAVDLSKYRVLLMPIAFLSSPQRAEGLPLNAEERHFLKYLESLRPDGTDEVTNDFNVALSIDVRVRRTKDSSGVPMTFSNAPNAIPVRLEEEDIRERYPWDYDVLTAQLSKRYTNFKANQRYHEVRQTVEVDQRYCRERLLDPGNPRSARKRFYNPNILKVFDSNYERAKPQIPPSTPGAS
jgi:hypothetical protein